MITTYLRSSSANMWKYDCKMKYFLEYVLGHRGMSGVAAHKGSVCHKVFEIMAVAKKAQQDGIAEIKDDICGTLNVVDYDIDKITDQVYAHFSTNLIPEKWVKKDYKDCKTWIYDLLNFNEGEFHPHNREIVNAEPKFDFELPYEWANYSYLLPDNTRLEGKCAIKGSIDLVTKIDDDTYEITDYKTGKRTNFFTGELKTHEVLAHDLQLMMYFYAAHNLYPDVKNFIVTIFFIRKEEGGPFSICFTKDDLKKTEDKLQEIFEDIKKTKTPSLSKSWRCSKLCHFYKNTYASTPTPILPMVEFRAGQFNKVGEDMCMCSQTDVALAKNGMGWVLKNLKNPGHEFDKYHNPGGIE